MDASRGEIKIRQILEMNDIPFKQEYTFPLLKSSKGRALRFDFAIFDDDGNLEFLIEYQGKQHYEASNKFGGKKGLCRQQYNDGRKRSFCALEGILLIEIPYTEEHLINYDYIMKKAGY